MTGSLQIKNDKYYAVLNLYDQNGKRRQKWITSELPVRGNKKRAEQFLREQLRQYEARERLEYSEMLFSDAVRQWLDRCAMKVDVITMQGYRTLADGHILPYFDALGVKLIDVERRTLQAYIDEKRLHGRKDGNGGLSPRSLRLHKNILFQTLKEAVRDNLIPNNPCEYVILPQQERPEFCYYNEMQLNTMLEAIKEEPLYPLVKITTIYGLRRSELLGLKWDSVDFIAGTLTVRHTVSKVTVAVEKDKTKNASSYRSFPLMPEIRALLLHEQEKQKENRRLFGKSYKNTDYIFTWPDGTPFSPDYVSHGFSKLLKKNGLPHIRFHELRHSCASFLVNNGFTLKDVQEWLGHSDIKITANIYSHLDVSRKQSMADKLVGSIQA